MVWVAVGAIARSMSGDRVTPKDAVNPLNTMLVESGKDGPRTSVWEGDVGQSGWTDERERRGWGMKLSLDQESSKDDGTLSHSTNGMYSLPSGNGKKNLGKEVSMSTVSIFKKNLPLIN